MRRITAGLLAGLAAALSAQTPDKVFVNGQVVTMDPAGRTAQAAAIRGERIVAVGTDAEVRKLAGGATVIDLAGKALLPGLYAAHDHFPGAGTVAVHQADLNSPPIGKMLSIADVVEALRAKARATPAGQWVTGRGYDDTLLREKRHPTRRDLDQASTAHPIWITHVSGHLGVANSRALALAGITRETPQPKAGRIHRDPATGEPDGVFEEAGGMVTRHIPGRTRSERLEAIAWCGREYLSKGITTAVIAGTTLPVIDDLRQAQASGALHLRIKALLASGASVPDSPAKAAALGSGDQIRVAGVKLLQDGSIQGYTGYLGGPYHKQPEGKADYRGYAMRSREELARLALQYHRAGHQIAIHGNGDAAIDDILFAFRQAQREAPRPDARHRIEHCQTPREGQLDEMRELGVTPSFFAGHVYYWGDRHRDIFLGPERAARISPLGSALSRGIRFTVHDDTPVTPANPLMLVWGAVNRLTRDGHVLGPGQRIPVMAALRAVTSDAAWQNFEEKSKGSIEPGKLADLVVLDRNPLTVPPAGIRNIAVLETIVGGRTVYTAPPRP
ncbi:MAG TPA: amidohydrolase [Bryobacteraceae bacterium]|nr:amidohydrolase [Bryobacteraceae bacterium]